MVSERLSALDLAFLCLEDDVAPLHLGGVAVFEPGLDASRMAELLAERVQRLPRLRQRPLVSWFPTAGAVWDDDPDFDVARHVVVHELRNGTREDVAALAGDVMAEPLDLTHPLWQLHVVTGLVGGHAAIVAKLHHALCDGLGALGLARGLFDGDVTPAPQPATSPASSTAPSLVRQLQDLASRRPEDLFAAGVAVAADAAERGRTVATIASDVLRAVRPAASPLLAEPSSARRVLLAELPMSEVRRVRHQYGGTSHDVLLSVVAGALRRWLLARGDTCDGVRIRALIPTNQRRGTADGSAGNQISGYLCDLPVSQSDPVGQLRTVRAAMDRNKAAGPYQGPGALPVMADLLPPVVHRLVAPVTRYAAPLLFDIVITTVPLAPMTLQLGGRPLRELYPLVPLAHGHALGVALTPYRDTVHIGLLGNPDALPDLDKIRDALPAALSALTTD